MPTTTEFKNPPVSEPINGLPQLVVASDYDSREPLTLSNRARSELSSQRVANVAPKDETGPEGSVHVVEPSVSGVRLSAMTVCEPGNAKSPATLTDIPAVEQSAPAAPLPQPRLRVIRGEILNAEFPILDGKNFIGRSADTPVDIDLTAQEAIERVWSSRQHAVITLERGSAVLEDLNSLNGTFVNRARLHPGHRRTLQPGDVIQIGTVQFRLEV